MYDNFEMTFVIHKNLSSVKDKCKNWYSAKDVLIFFYIQLNPEFQSIGCSV